MRDQKVASEPVTFMQRHIKFSMGNDLVETVGFDMASRKVELEKSSARFDLAFKMQIDNYANSNKIQLILQDFRPSEPLS
ncbi:MAG: hypothetical protein P9M03_08145 [Candidatus Theseobacter exili]|nr:hypothetical protein [Candidatus Theseobacter exili]